MDKCRLWTCVAGLVPRPFVMIIVAPRLSDPSILSALILEVQQFARAVGKFPVYYTHGPRLFSLQP